MRRRRAPRRLVFRVRRSGVNEDESRFLREDTRVVVVVPSVALITKGVVVFLHAPHFESSFYAEPFRRKVRRWFSRSFALLFPKVSVFSSQKRDASFVYQKCPHAPRGVCIPRPRCVQIHRHKSRRRCLSLVVAHVARRFRTPRMSSSRTSLHRVRIIIVKKESQQTGGKKMRPTR